MTIRHALLATTLVAAGLLSGCNDDNRPAPGVPVENPTPAPGGSFSLSEFAASLLAMVTGGACATATPVGVNAQTLTDDMTAQDANAIASGNCS